MVEDRATHPEAEAFKEGRAQTRRGSPLLRGHPVGASQRSSVERSTTAVSLARDVLAPCPEVGGRGSLAWPLEGVPRTNRRGGHPVVG